MIPEGYIPDYNKLKTPISLPDFIAKGVLDVDFAKLYKDLGVKHVLLDVDLTVRPLKAKQIQNEIIEYLNNHKHSKNIKSISLVTNNRRDLQHLADSLQARLFQPKYGLHKPHRKFFTHVLEQIGAKPHETVMIGDKIRPDIMGANRVGIYTVWVKPLGRDYIYDRILLTRLREQIILKYLRAKRHKK